MNTDIDRMPPQRKRGGLLEGFEGAVVIAPYYKQVIHISIKSSTRLTTDNRSARIQS